MGRPPFYQRENEGETMAADLAARAREKGWPDGLLARAQAHFSDWELENLFLAANARPQAELERELDVRERTAKGPFRIREMNARDAYGLSELWAHAPEALGEWSVTVERSPNPMAQFTLHDDCCITVLEEGGKLFACTAWSHRNVNVAGAPTKILVAHSLRVHESRRGERLADLVRRYPIRATFAKPTMAQYMYVRRDNANVLGFMKTVAPQTFSNVGVAGVVTEVSIFPARAGAAPAGVRKVERADLAACVPLINRTHGALDLFGTYTEENLALRLGQTYPGQAPPPEAWRHVYGWQDYWVLEESGRIVACGGLWDRGRDVREVWRHKGGETRTLAFTNLLDFGFAEGGEDAMARLIGHFISETARLERHSFVAPLDRLPALAAACASFEPRIEGRTFEWSPFIPQAPRVIAAPYTDLRYW